MKDYLDFNKKVYDELSEEFREKIDIRKDNSNKVVDNFAKFLEKRYEKKDINILELGPGSGYVCKKLSEKGYDTTAIEFSSKMAKVCKDTTPKTKVIIDEFLSHDFEAQKFSGVMAIAFIHLFPTTNAHFVMKKIKTLLKPNGLLYMGTTFHKSSSEGLYPKVNFKKKLLRFRRKFTRKEFEDMLETSGFEIIKSLDFPDDEEEGKVWMDYIAKVSS